MCGLWGVIGNHIGKNEVQCFRELGLISSLRGLDSTGITIVSKAKKNKWNVEYSKEATDATNFLFFNKKTNNILENTRNVFAIMGHARAATIGTVSKDNAHPFHVGPLLGMHNGTILSLGNKDKTDSQHLYENILARGVKPAINDIVGSAAYALTWCDTRTSTINILRNNQRSLWAMFEKNNGLMYYASERSFLKLIDERSTRIFNEPVLIQEDQLFTIKFGEFDIDKEEVKREFVPSFFPAKKPDGEVPFNKSQVVPIGPPMARHSLPDGPSLEVLNAVPALEVEYETERLKFDPAQDVFPQKPVSGYPFKVHLRHPDLPSKFLKILRFNDFYGRYLAPATIEPLLQQGCIISGLKATVNDTVYWISPDIYVMPAYRDDVFVKECIQVYGLKQAKMARACYASAYALNEHNKAIEARSKKINDNSQVHVG